MDHEAIRLAWVYDPQSGSEKIAPLLQDQVSKRLIQHAAKIVPGKEGWLRLRFHRKFCYVDAQKPGVPFLTHLCRLRYLGKPDRWSMAFYTYSNERYEPCLFDLAGGKAHQKRPLRSVRCIWRGSTKPLKVLPVGATFRSAR